MKKILIVDDDQNLREIYTDILTKEGYSIDQAKDGEEGYYALSRGGYDLILLDLILPKMDGLMILQKLRSEAPLKPNGPIIILSNIGQSTLNEKVLTLGAKESITKSDYTPDQIVAKVKNYLK